MFKILVLQLWYGLSDLEVERQMAECISFMAFLGFPNPYPDSRKIWLFKEHMAKIEKNKWSGKSFKGSWMLWVYRYH
jgi:transposase, IS5 family